MKAFLFSFLASSIAFAGITGGGIIHQQRVPSGVVFAFVGANCPTGALAIDGTAVSRTTYGALFTQAGTTFGAGDGSTTFNLPNGKGIFIRGVGSQSIGGVTYTGSRGSTNGDTFQEHAHAAGGVGSLAVSPNPHSHSVGQLSATNFSTGSSDTMITGANSIATSTTSLSITGAPGAPGAPTTDAQGVPRTGAETAPANLGLQYCVFI